MSIAITGLTNYSSPQPTDVLVIVDVATGLTKKITASTLVNAFLPVGATQIWHTSSPPTNWLICDGSAVSRTTYAALFAVLGTTQGVGDGSTTFNLPDMRQYVAVGRKSGDTDFGTLGATGGAKTHTLTEAEMPAHTHTQTSHNHSASTGSGGSHTHSTGSGGSHNHSIGPVGTSGSYGFVDSAHASSSGTGYTSSNGAHTHSVSTDGAHTHSVSVSSATATNQNTGGDGAHNNIQPYKVVNYIIKF